MVCNHSIKYMVKEAIGIIDAGFEGLNILFTLSKNLKHERFIYMNDIKNYPYINLSEEEVLDIIKKNIDLLIDRGIKLLIVASDTIVEYASEYLTTLSVPVLNIVNTLIDYVNVNYEQKNMVLFAKSEIIEANIYQKFFKYNRLYNIPSNDLEEIINQKMVKTSESFSQTLETFKALLRKDIDVIITSSPYLINLKTEITEYLTVNEITDVGEIFANKIKDEFYNLNEKGRSSRLVISNIPKKEFMKHAYWVKEKYQYENLEVKKQK